MNTISQVGLTGFGSSVLLLFGGGCEQTDGGATIDPASPVVAPAPPSPWRTSGTSAQIAVEDPELVRALEAATERARTGQEEVRRRWVEVGPEGRAEWAVKWATPTEDGGTEHIWVLPLVWSAYRIEGLLLDAPQRPLRYGHAEGDLVAFPADEVSDWLRVDNQGRREGGFTIDVLEEWYGTPPVPTDG